MKKNDPPRYRVVKTAEGHCWFVAGSRGLLRCGLPETTRADARDRVVAEYPDSREDARLLPDLAEDLVGYFRGDVVRFRVRLDESGLTDFQRVVYRALRRVGRGKTTTYGELASRAGRDGAARGVGVAMARNPFPPIVPCHRVLTSGGGLGGFTATGGRDLKLRMIALEGGAA